MNYGLIIIYFDTGECTGVHLGAGAAAPGRLVGERATTRRDYYLGEFLIVIYIYFF